MSVSWWIWIIFRVSKLAKYLLRFDQKPYLGPYIWEQPQNLVVVSHYFAKYQFFDKSQ